VTDIAALLDLGHFGVFFGMWYGQFEILDLVPVMHVGLRHHRLPPLLVDVDMARSATVFGCAEILVDKRTLMGGLRLDCARQKE